MSIISNAAHQASSLTKLYADGMKGIAKQAGHDSAQVIKAGAKDLAATAEGAINTELDRASRAVVRADQFVKGAALATKAEAHYLQSSAKGAINTEIDRASRAVVRADQFVSGAALATQAEARYVGKKVNSAAEEITALVRRDLANTKTDFKGAIANAFDRFDRAVVRADQFATGAALATKAEGRYVGQQVKGAAEDAAAFIRRDLAATKSDVKGAAANAFDRLDRTIERADQFVTGAALTGKTAVNQGIQRVEIQSALAVHGVKQQGRKVGQLLEDAHLVVRSEVFKAQQNLGESLIKLGQKIAE